MARHIFAAEVSHENAPPYIREKLAGNEAGIKTCIQHLKAELDEVFVLSTDTRFVVYAVSETLDPLLNFFLQDPQFIRYVQFYKNTEASANHIFATASGLCSQVKGERHILSQIKNAYKLAVECESIGLILDNLIRDAVRVGRKVRNETGIDKFSLGIVETGFSLVYDKLVNIYERNFLIIGTSEISRLALAALSKEGIHNVVLAGFDIQETVSLAAKYNVTPIYIDKVLPYLAEADVIIGENHEVLMSAGSWSDVSLKKHETKLLRKKHIILDFGMPRNFIKKLQDLKSMDIYSLSALKKIQIPSQENIDKLDLAWKIVASEASEFLVLIQQLERAPVLATYWTSLVNGVLPSLEKTIIHDPQKLMVNKLRETARAHTKKFYALVSDTQAGRQKEVVRNLRDFSHIKLNLSNN